MIQSKHLLTLFSAAVIGVFGYVFVSGSQPMGVGVPKGWHSDLDSALAEATKRHVPVMVDFASDTCTACLQMEKDTFPIAAVGASLKNVVPVRILLDENTSKVFDKFHVNVMPTIVMLKPNGSESKRNTGFMSAADLTAFLKDNS